MTQKIEFSLNILLALTNKLTQLIIEETDYLRRMKIGEISKIQAEKSEIASMLEKQQNELRTNPEARASLSVEDKADLKRAAMHFDAAIADYQEELFKARKVNELVIGKVVESIKDHVTRNRTYNAGGTKVANGMELAKNTPAMKFNAQV